MKRIIVPVDFSVHSEYALETAAILAKKYEAEIIVLHMLEVANAVLTTSTSELQQESAFFLKIAEQKMQSFLNKSYLKGIKVAPIIKHYKVFNEVNEIALSQNADLIVMGSQGVSGLKEILIGSNTEKMVRYADIPVLVIKEHPILTDFETVVFASSFSNEDINAYKKAKKLFELLKIEMHLVYVNTPSLSFRSTSEMQKNIASFLKQADGNLANIKHVSYVSDYTIEKGILSFADSIKADLIAIATHGKKGITHFIEGSLSEDVANHSVLPVMTFKI